MELRHLRYFVAVAEELHFGQAAQRLHMAQQPLSRQIRALETELQVQLFHRTKRTVRLTEVGQVFLIEARKILHQVEQAIRTAQQTSQGDIGQFAIGFTGPALNSVLPKIIRRFKERYPQVKLELERLQTPEQVEALMSGQIQIGLLHPPIDNNALVLETIHREGLVAVLPDSHRLAQTASQPISIRELADDSFILYPRHIGPVLYDRIINLCQRAGFSPKIVQEVSPQQTILGLVSAAVGVSLLHASAQVVAPAGVVIRDLLEPTPVLELAIAWHPETTNPVLSTFLAIVREVVSEQSHTY
ncbi:LysR family transcriptional regulator [filamentous cyanobacterium CCT1]|nr:LysR family transcriptional regulator [filamentous cyanobacterium CCT1]PSN76603.1 LysR family transcriptional regulator [filamentous cyanobacterium CCP4]